MHFAIKWTWPTQRGTFEKSCTLLSNSCNFIKYHSLNCCIMLINIIVAWNFSKCDRWFKNYNCCNDSATTIFVMTVGLSQCIGVSGKCLSCTSHSFVLRMTSNYCFLSFTIKELLFCHDSGTVSMHRCIWQMSELHIAFFRS